MARLHEFSMETQRVKPGHAVRFVRRPFILFLPIVLSLLATHESLCFASSGIVAWGYDGYGETNVPAGLTNVTAIAVGAFHSLAFKQNGTVAGWGYNVHGEATPPAGLSNVVAIAAGYYHSLALQSNGTVVGWGDNNGGEISIPQGLSNVVAIAAGGRDGNEDFSLALRGDGTVAAWGGYALGGAQWSLPAGLSNVVAISAGMFYGMALRSDGTVVAWDYGINGYGASTVPAGLTNVVAIAAGAVHSLAVKLDGTVVAWGGNGSGQTNVPADLTNVVAVAAGGHGTENDWDGYSIALRSDGTIESWGYLLNPDGCSNVLGIAGEWSHAMALTNDRLPAIVRQPWNQTLYGGYSTILSMGAIGSSLAYQWSLNGMPLLNATNYFLSVTNVQPLQAGSYRAIVSSASGSVTSSVALLNVLTNPPVISLQVSNLTVALGSNAVFAPAIAPGPIPITFQWQFNGTNLPGSTNSSLTIENAQLTQQGTYNLVVMNPYGVTVSSDAVLTIADLGLSLNAANLFWTNADNAPWFAETGVAHDGVAAAQSGAIGAGQKSTLQTTVLGPGILKFWWKFAWHNPDSFSFSMNGIVKTNLQSSVAWQQQSFPLAAGPQLLQWTYSRSPSGYVMSTGWVDQVEYTPFALHALTSGAWPPTNGFKIQAVGVWATNQVLIYASSNLVTWVSIITNPPTTGSLQVIDYTATNLPVQFYRAWEQ